MASKSDGEINYERFRRQHAGDTLAMDTALVSRNKFLKKPPGRPNNDIQTHMEE